MFPLDFRELKAKEIVPTFAFISVCNIFNISFGALFIEHISFHSGMDKPTYQRAVTPTMDTNGVPSGNASLVRGKIMSYQANQLRRGAGGKGIGPGEGGCSTSNATGHNQLAQQAIQQDIQLQAAQHYTQRSSEMGIQGRNALGKSGVAATGNDNSGTGGDSSGIAAGRKIGMMPIVYNPNKVGTDANSDSAVASSSAFQRFDLVPIVDDIPPDGIIFARIRNDPESLVVFRTPEERLRNPERLNLDRRQLDVCPMLEQELRLRLLNFQNNNIRHVQHLENLPNLIFLDMYNNKLATLDGPISSVRGLRVLMAGKNRITAISNLSTLRKLDVLDLHSNDIKQIEGLQGLADLRVLNLAGNSIPLVHNLTSLQSLTELNLRRNVIEKVHELDKLPALQRVFLSHNLITNLMDIQCLFTVKFLIELSLDGNPLSEGDTAQYRAKIISGIPSLRHLDLKRVSDEERVLALPARKLVEAELGWNEDDSDTITGIQGEANGNHLRMHPDSEGANRLGEDMRMGGEDGGYQNRGMAALARAGRIPATQCLFDLELIGATEKALVAVGDAWEWIQAKRLLVNVTEASLYHMKRNVITSKFATNISWLPSLKCLRLFNNELESLKDVDIVFDALGNINIEHLCIKDNPICSLANLLRAYVIVCMPSLKSFNELEIKDVERQEAVRTLEPVLKIHNMAISQQVCAAPGGVPSTRGGQFGGALLKPRTVPQPRRAFSNVMGRVVSGSGSGQGVGSNAADEQAIAELCQEISTTALNRRKFRGDFDEQLRASVKQIFVDTVMQLSSDKI